MNEKIKILHLEDNALDAELVKSHIILEGLNCEIVRAKKKDEFLKQLDESKFDIILSDNSLPDFDGLSALRYVRERNKNVPFIFLSGTLAEEIAINAMRFGATDYVLKKNINKVGLVINRALHEYHQQMEIEKVNNNIRLSEERMRLVNKATQDIIIDIDIESQKFYWSDIASQKLLYKKEELGGYEWWFDRIFDEDKPAVRKMIEDISYNDQEVLVHEYRFRLGDGRYSFMEDSLYIIRDENKKPVRVIVSMNDLTKRKEYEAELKAAKEKAELSDRLKTEFLAQMSHEIRTPLNIILSFSRMLIDEEGIETNPEKKELKEIVETSGKRLTRTIDSILNMSELQIGSYKINMETIDIMDVVVLPIYREYKLTAANKNLQFVINKNTDKTMITSDVYALVQIFSNLVDNAIKFTKEGTVGINIYADNYKKIIVEVFDTGIGISDEFRKNIFEPFRQEEQGYSRSFDGNGLGLALVKKYCSLVNADISIESKKKFGSKFTIKFN